MSIKLTRKVNNYILNLYYFCATNISYVRMNRILEVTPESRVVFGRATNLLPQLLPEGRVIAVIDARVDALYPSLCGGFERIIIDGGEPSKSLASLERIYTALIEKSADRGCFLLGIGGGVTTDVTGFVASTYMRGVRFGFVTTTLLGAVDASVGGKNGVNIGGYKNMVGTFSHPSFVICDAELFTTLPEREFRAGLAEVVKSAIIADERLFELLETTTLEELRGGGALLDEIVERSLRVKANVVRADERESGLRRVLNLGHTIAHAIEKSVCGYNHGEAVAIGLCVVARIAVAERLLSSSDGSRIEKLLQRFGFETALPLPVATLADAAVKDKKRAGDELHIILPTAIGCVCDRPIGVESVVELLERV